MAKHFSEREFIAQIKARLSVQHGLVVKAIGDDCAVVRKAGDRLELLTMDTLVENVHFDRAWHLPELLGRKAASVNLSDIAAMGGVPQYALLSLAVPYAVESSWLALFMDGFLEALAEHDVLLIGGDTVKSGHEIMVSVTVLGEIDERHVLYRDGASSGDLVWISGVPGEAAAGLALCKAGLADNSGWQPLVAAHLDPNPEVVLGAILAQSGLVHAMMDTSDGIATDLAHICKESGKGAEITATDIPASDFLTKASRHLGVSTIDWALKGGEDFHLLFTAAEDRRAELEKLVHEQTGRKIYCIGSIVDEPGVYLVKDGERIDIAYQGYDHFSE